MWTDDVLDVGTSNWQASMERAIDNAKAVVCILSPGLKESPLVNMEIEYAKRLDKHVYLAIGEKGVIWDMTPSGYELNRTFAVYDKVDSIKQLIMTIKCDLGIGEVSIAYTGKTEALAPLPKPVILPDPFEWITIPVGQINLEAGGYVPVSRQTFSVEPFYIAKFPITNAQYEKYVEAGGKKPKLRKRGDSGFTGALKPVVMITWHDAYAFCEWLSVETGYHITLPTEQQWQRAAQGDDKRFYPWGNRADAHKANTRELQAKPPFTFNVTQYPQGASPYDVMDMVGNVSEWCLNDYETGDITPNNTEANRVKRGGSIATPLESARNGKREWFDSKLSYYTGFRCACIPT